MRPILILGAGIGGLTTAIALRRAGIACHIIERVPELRPVGAGLSIQVNAMRVLARLGLEEKVAASGAPLDHPTIRTSRGRVLQRMDMAAVRQRYGHGAFGVHRGRLQQILLDAAGGTPLELGVETTAIDDRGDHVLLRFEDGRELEGAALIGCDGLHSYVRAWLWGDRPLRYAGYTSWRGLCPNDGRVAEGEANETWGAGRRFGYASVGHNQIYWFGTETAPADGRDGPDVIAELQARFHDWHPPISSLIAATDSDAAIRTDIYDLPPRNAWGRGLVTLLGDAAHPMTPNLGQGACQAIEDAWALAAQFAGAKGVADALRRYEQARQKRTSEMVDSSWRFGAVAQGDSLVIRLLRDYVAPLVTPLIMPSQIRWLYDE